MSLTDDLRYNPDRRPLSENGPQLFMRLGDRALRMEPLDVEMVREFHLAFAVPSRRPGTNYMSREPAPDTTEAEPDFRLRLILEESNETIREGLMQSDPIKLMDGCADVRYVCAGTEVQLGLERLYACDPEARQAVTQLIQAAQNNIKDAMTARSVVLLRQSLLQFRIIIAGIMAELGMPERDVFVEVHRSNMSKVWDDGTVRKDEGGKVLKPATYSRADLVAILHLNEDADL